ncbi:MAG: hypothetical protein FJ126_05485 [Deltaproteobacteria bacterium]|nr:hypothetical protein [Deltaproteobacteria bacterium]
MTSNWEHQFRNRMSQFEAERPLRTDEVALSIKARVNLGCFHRQHSPHAYEIIDEYLHSNRVELLNISFEEHESGPEILVYMAVTAAGLQLAASIINLIATIIKARSEGVKRGDSRSAPVDLIVRRMDKDGKFYEEKVLEFRYRDPVDQKVIEIKLKEGIAKCLGINEPEDSRNQEK